MKNYEKYLHSFGYRISTVTAIANTTKQFLSWCTGQNINPINVVYTDVMSYLEFVSEKTTNHRTISGKVQAVRVYYNYLIRKSMVDINPVKDLQIRNRIKRVPKNNLKYEQLIELYQNLSGKGITGKRNKIMLGLMIYQGFNTAELTEVEVKDVNIHEGIIYIPQTGRANSRTLKLEAQQVMEIQNYIRQYRPMLLAMHKKKSNKLILSAGKGKKLNNTCFALLNTLRKVNPQIKSIHQIKAAVMNHWLKKYSTRQVQYMAGHRYVSSTEIYSTKKIESLQEQLEKLMPEI